MRLVCAKKLILCPAADNKKMPLRRGGGAGNVEKVAGHFFEEGLALRSAPRLAAKGGQFDAHSASSIFCHAQVAAENDFTLFAASGRRTLRGDSTSCAPPQGRRGGFTKMSDGVSGRGRRRSGPCPAAAPAERRSPPACAATSPRPRGSVRRR